MKLKPYMTENEIKFFEKYLKNSKKYLEFGSGGSTYFAIKNGGFVVLFGEIWRF